jgi:hypothetical protein
MNEQELKELALQLHKAQILLNLYLFQYKVMLSLHL